MRNGLTLIALALLWACSSTDRRSEVVDTSLPNGVAPLASAIDLANANMMENADQNLDDASNAATERALNAVADNLAATAGAESGVPAYAPGDTPTGADPGTGLPFGSGSQPLGSLSSSGQDSPNSDESGD